MPDFTITTARGSVTVQGPGGSADANVARQAAQRAIQAAEDAVDAARAEVLAGATLMTVTQSAPGAVARTVQSKLRDVVSVADFGVVADGVADDTAAFTAAIAAARDRGQTLLFPSGRVVRLTSYLNVAAAGKAVSWASDGAQPCVLLVEGAGEGECVYIHGEIAGETTLALSAGTSARRVTVASAAGIVPGMLVELISNQAWYHDPRSAPGMTVSSSGQVQSATASTLVLAPSYDNTRAPIFSGATITAISSEGAEEAKTILSYDDATKTVTISGSWSVTPDSSYTYAFSLAFAVAPVASATSNTITLARWVRTLPSPYIGRAITIIDGAGWKQARTVTAFDVETGTAALSRAWATQPDATSVALVPQCYKGELNEVVSVAGNVLELRNDLKLGYDVEAVSGGVAKEDVRVRFVTPCAVRMRGIEVRRASDIGSSNVQALRVQYARRALFEDVTLTRARRSGLQIERCYEVDTVRIRADGCDGTFTGYGISNQCAWRVRHRDGRFWGTRRGIDAHSTYYSGPDEYPSGFLEYLDCEAVGGGQRQDGADWGALGSVTTEGTTSAENYGFGSHGPAFFVRYINPRIHSVHCGFLLRAAKEEIINAQVTGRCDVVVKVWYGGDHVVQNLRYVHPVTQGNDDLADYYRETLVFGSGGVDFRDHLPLRHIEIAGSSTYSRYRRGLVRITGGEAHVRDTVVYLGLGGAAEWCDVEVDGLDIHAWAPDASTAYLVNGNSGATLKRFRDVGNPVTVHRGQWLRYRWQFAPDASCIIRPYGSPPETFVTVTTPGSTTAGINPASAPSSSAGAAVLVTPALTPTVETAGYDVDFDLPVMRSDAGGTRMIWQLWRFRSGVANLCVAAGVVDLVAQNRITRITGLVRDFHGTYLPVHYQLRVGPRSGEAGTLRWIGDETGSAYFGAASFMRGTMRVREVYAG